ncbi:MAG TPA: hypothetical protein VNO86_11745 [Candidatus Binatia bacterium]|nr:hypothetical protein [Candidatus Binatia bacterium]
MRRILIVATAAVVLLAVAVGLQDRAVPAFVYCLRGERTLVVPVMSGPMTWTRVGSLTESPNSVVIEVRELRAPGPSAVGELIGLVVHLRDPLGTRDVIDGFTGLVMQPDIFDCQGVRIQEARDAYDGLPGTIKTAG